MIKTGKLMLKAYPLILENTQFVNHGIIGIYPLKDKIAVVHCAFRHVDEEKNNEEKCLQSYILLDIFSKDFTKHSKTHLIYHQEGIFSKTDAACYIESDKFLLNTKKYKGFAPSIAKLIEISDTNLIELEESPEPIDKIYNDSKTYHFGEYEIYMFSKSIMACRNIKSKEIVWKLKLGSYLYTEVKEEKSILYFGTAGNGGKFFAVNMHDGSLLYSYKTGGTENFIQYKNYILLADIKNKPILLNKKNGMEFKKIDFGNFQITAYQQMIVIEDTLYAIAFSEDTVYAVCADLL
ncbi:MULTISPECIES: hypothetical protein [unclassified Treponema]|uniref:hypothetical protein n=1 Tax=unclassified Treponema TaxID=2638727 RepID=UPI0020A4B9D8|nr:MULTISPECIES: hypothetical protein [unclassified Treponema]